MYHRAFAFLVLCIAGPFVYFGCVDRPGMCDTFDVHRTARVVGTHVTQRTCDTHVGDYMCYNTYVDIALPHMNCSVSVGNTDDPHESRAVRAASKYDVGSVHTVLTFRPDRAGTFRHRTECNFYNQAVRSYAIVGLVLVVLSSTTCCWCPKRPTREVSERSDVVVEIPPSSGNLPGERLQERV